MKSLVRRQMSLAARVQWQMFTPTPSPRSQRQRWSRRRQQCRRQQRRSQQNRQSSRLRHRQWRATSATIPPTSLSLQSNRSLSKVKVCCSNQVRMNVRRVERWHQPLSLGQEPITLQDFAENCMKMKDSGGWGGTSLAPPGSANVISFHSCCRVLHDGDVEEQASPSERWLDETDLASGRRD